MEKGQKTGPTKKFVHGCIAVLLFFCSNQDVWANGIAVVAGSKVTSINLSTDELRRIFLGKQRKWSDGKSIKVAILDGGDLHQAFLDQIVGKSKMQYKRYWRKIVFSGKGMMPRVFKTKEELLEYLKEEPYAIGYIDPTDIREGLILLYKKSERRDSR